MAKVLEGRYINEGEVNSGTNRENIQQHDQYAGLGLSFEDLQELSNS